jgi:hypothetical protein
LICNYPKQSHKNIFVQFGEKSGKSQVERQMDRYQRKSKLIVPFGKAGREMTTVYLCDLELSL